MTIRIQNPTPGGSAFTNDQSAKRLVRRGRAAFIHSGLLRIIEPLSAPLGGRSVEFETGLFYDRLSKVMNRKQQAGIPMMHGERMR